MAARVLLVDDNPLNMELASAVLARAGFEVVCAETAEDGLQLLAARPPDLVLLDLGLPGMGGLEAARRIKADPGTRHIPVVAVTAHAMRGDEAVARAAGCDGYIAKPIQTRTFAGTVASYLPGGPPPAPEAGS